MTDAPELIVRPATLTDVPAIADIEREAFSDPWSVKSFRELVDRQDVLFVVAALGGATGGQAAELVGFLIIYTVDSEADLANIAIAASARGRGLGRRLLRHGLAEARARGVHIVFLEVRESNGAARALYNSEGFLEVGRRAKYYARPVEDALILRKDLV